MKKHLRLNFSIDNRKIFDIMVTNDNSVEELKDSGYKIKIQDRQTLEIRWK